MSLFWFVLRILRHFFRFSVFMWAAAAADLAQWTRDHKVIKVLLLLVCAVWTIFKLFLLFLYILLLNCLLLAVSGKCICRVLCQWFFFPCSPPLSPSLSLQILFLSPLLTALKFMRSAYLTLRSVFLFISFICQYFFFFLVFNTNGKILFENNVFLKCVAYFFGAAAQLIVHIIL